MCCGSVAYVAVLPFRFSSWWRYWLSVSSSLNVSSSHGVHLGYSTSSGRRVLNSESIQLGGAAEAEEDCVKYRLESVVVMERGVGVDVGGLVMVPVMVLVLGLDCRRARDRNQNQN